MFFIVTLRFQDVRENPASWTDRQRENSKPTHTQCLRRGGGGAGRVTMYRY